MADGLAGLGRLTYIGNEPGIALAEEGPFDQVLRIDDRDAWTDAARRQLAKSQLVVSFLDYRALRLAHRYGVPSVFVDSLFWLRDRLPPCTDLAERYIAQRSLPIECGWLPVEETDVEFVAPIFPAWLEGHVCSRTQSNEKTRILVNFGGLRSPALTEAHGLAYIRWVLDIVHRARLRATTAVTVCAPRVYARRLRSERNVAFLSQREFHEQLASADVLVTTPGQEVVLESMSLGISLIFLPPANASQLYQCRGYQREGIPLECLWPPQLDGLALPNPGLNQLTTEIHDCLRESQACEAVTNALAADLRKAVLRVQTDPENVASNREANRAHIRMLGQGGRQRVVDIIAEVLAIRRAVDRHYPGDLPRYVELETSRFCNRRCGWCPNGSFDTRTEQELMPWDLFVDIISQLRDLHYRGWLAFHNYNEPLANPRLLQEIRWAVSQLPETLPSVFTNGDLVTPALLEALGDAGVRHVRITLYPAERSAVSGVPPKPERVRRWIERKNLHAVQRWVCGQSRYGWVAKAERGNMQLEVISPDLGSYNWRGGTAALISGVERHEPCYMTHHSASIDYRGRFKMCCNVYPECAGHSQYVIGDLGRQAFAGLWYSERMCQYRRWHMTANWSRSPICARCTQQLPGEQVRALRLAVAE